MSESSVAVCKEMYKSQLTVFVVQPAVYALA
jgi:hypothetical protein